MEPQGISDFVFTPHALLEMQRREISEESVRRVLAQPEQRLAVRPGRVVLQSRISSGTPEKRHLLRVFADVDRHPAEVVTVYLTTQIGKYWRANP